MFSLLAGCVHAVLCAVCGDVGCGMGYEKSEDALLRIITFSAQSDRETGETLVLILMSLMT